MIIPANYLIEFERSLSPARPAEYELVKQLFSVLPAEPCGHGKSQLCSRVGADAVEAALTLNRYHSGRPGIVSFHWATTA